MTNIDEQMVFRTSDKVVWRKYLRSVVIEPGIALNETAAAVFERLDGARTIGQICREVVDEFDVEYSVCLSDTRALVSEMLEHGMLEQVANN